MRKEDEEEDYLDDSESEKSLNRLLQVDKTKCVLTLLFKFILTPKTPSTRPNVAALSL